MIVSARQLPSHRAPEAYSLLRTLTEERPACACEVRAPLDATMGGDLVLVRTLAHGGMASIELAVQRSRDRIVVLKRPLDGRPEASAAILREADVLAALDHPHVVPMVGLTYDVEGRPVLAMEYVRGETWAQRLHDPAIARSSLRADVDVLARVADVVQHAHDRGWLHRDIKPANVLVGLAGEVYLIDWGLALPLPVEVGGTLTPLGVGAGTPRYMAPEMLQGVGPWLTPRTDVYLLGATLHEVLTGAARHRGDTLRATLYAAWVSERFEYPAAVPRALARLANDATSPWPERRPPSAAAFRERALAWREGEA
jgi:serine/threonine-protein kinase